MAFNYTYDLTTDVGKVREMIGDNPDDSSSSLTGNRRTWKSVLADEEISAVVTQAGSSLYEAASHLLLFIASNRSLLAKMISVGDYKLDTRDLAKDMRAQAQALQELANNTPAEAIVENFGQQFVAERLVIRDLLAQIPGWQDVSLP